MVVIIPERPVDERGLAGLRRPIDDVGFSDELAVDLAVGLADGHHPFFALEDLVIGADQVDEAALVQVGPVFCR